jgi:hypothetical protein
MRILILTDSLALPRDTPQKVSFDETWVQHLRKELNHEIHQLSIGGATIDVLWKQYPYHKLFNPDVLIIQCGIVDCAPRALSKMEDSIINSTRLTKKLGNFILPKIKIWLRQTRNITLTKATVFNSYLNKFSKLELPVYFIGIVPCTERYEKTNPGIKKNISLFNDLIKKNFPDRTISLASLNDFDVMSDQHHLNVCGHKKIASLVADAIDASILGQEF